jgi:hypothetical protein
MSFNAADIARNKIEAEVLFTEATAQGTVFVADPLAVELLCRFANKHKLSLYTLFANNATLRQKTADLLRQAPRNTAGFENPQHIESELAQIYENTLERIQAQTQEMETLWQDASASNLSSQIKKGAKTPHTGFLTDDDYRNYLGKRINSHPQLTTGNPKFVLILPQAFSLTEQQADSPNSFNSCKDVLEKAIRVLPNNCTTKLLGAASFNLNGSNASGSDNHWVYISCTVAKDAKGSFKIIAAEFKDSLGGSLYTMGSSSACSNFNAAIKSLDNTANSASYVNSSTQKDGFSCLDRALQAIDLASGYKSTLSTLDPRNDNFANQARTAVFEQIQKNLGTQKVNISTAGILSELQNKAARLSNQALNKLLDSKLGAKETTVSDYIKRLELIFNHPDSSEQDLLNKVQSIDIQIDEAISEADENSTAGTPSTNI